MKKVISLRELAHARSGDKGGNANIGVIAYHEEAYQILHRNLTAERVHHHFCLLSPRSTIRYEVPNLLAFNFILYGILDEGGSRSLRIDSQGKSLAEALLFLSIEL